MHGRASFPQSKAIEGALKTIIDYVCTLYLPISCIYHNYDRVVHVHAYSMTIKMRSNLCVILRWTSTADAVAAKLVDRLGTVMTRGSKRRAVRSGMMRWGKKVVSMGPVRPAVKDQGRGMTRSVVELGRGSPVAHRPGPEAPPPHETLRYAIDCTALLICQHPNLFVMLMICMLIIAIIIDLLDGQDQHA